MAAKVFTDRHIREYFADPILSGENLGKEPVRLQDFITRVEQPGRYSVFRFECSSPEGDIQNILNDYYGYLYNGNFLHRLRFDQYAVHHFAFKPNSIAKWLYGDTNMAYTLFLFNDIQHESDLTPQFLESEGLLVLNKEGLRALDKILTFKERVETEIGYAAFYKTSE